MKDEDAGLKQKANAEDIAWATRLSERSIVICNGDGETIWINRATRKTLGHQPLSELLPRFHHEIVQEVMRTQKSKKEEQEFGDETWTWEYRYSSERELVFLYGDNVTIQRQHEYDAYHDPLTGLPNRRSFELSLTAALKQRRQDKRYHFALVYLDIDHFKAFNDDHGHEVGDYVLQELAERLRTHLRPDDSVARRGGEELGIILAWLKSGGNEVLKQQIQSILEKLQEIIRLPMSFGEATVFVTVSFGVTIGQPNQTERDLHVKADQALYQAKRAGRDCICFSD